MNPIRIRAAELALQIANACQKEPPGTGTRIDIQDGDWEIICMGLGLLACTDDSADEFKKVN